MAARARPIIGTVVFFVAAPCAVAIILGQALPLACEEPTLSRRYGDGFGAYRREVR